METKVNTFSGKSTNGISEVSQYPEHKPNFVKEKSDGTNCETTENTRYGLQYAPH